MGYGCDTLSAVSGLRHLAYSVHHQHGCLPESSVASFQAQWSDRAIPEKVVGKTQQIPAAESLNFRLAMCLPHKAKSTVKPRAFALTSEVAFASGISSQPGWAISQAMTRTEALSCSR